MHPEETSMTLAVDRTTRPTFPAYSPFSPEQLLDPYPVYAEARREAPVFYSPELEMWVLTKYQDVRLVYEHPEIFSNSAVLSPRSGLPKAIAEEFAGWTLPMEKQAVMSDPPQHTRLKRLMMKAFTPGRVAQFAPWIRQIVDSLIDEFQHARSTNLVEAFTSKVPTDVIGRILGVPTQDSRKFRQWVGEIVLLAGTWDVSEEEQIGAWRGIRQFDEYVRQLVAERRLHRQEDVVSYLIEATSEDGSPALSDEEVVHSVINIAGAGADTTGNLIALTVYLLLHRPQRWQAVRDDHGLIGVAIEESMRYASVVRGLVRRTTQAVDIRGIKIPEGEFVYIALTSANRDEDIFQNADVYDMRRVGVRNHMSFGMGAHTCAGASLARLETKTAITALLERFPQLSLSDARAGLNFKKNNMIPGIKSVQVEW
jgi:cytochrome P450